MIIWVYGEDTFRSRQKLKELTAGFKDKFDAGGINLIFFKEKFSKEELMAATSSMPFMAPKKMVVVENLYQQSKAKEWEAISNFLKNVPEEAIVVLWEEKSAKELAKAFGSMPKKDVYYYDYPLLSPGELGKWLTSRAKDKKINISQQIINQLLEKVGQDTWRLDSELDKLRARALGGEVKKEYIDELVDTRLEDNVFLFCDFLAQKKIANAEDVLERLIKAGFNEVELLSKLIWQLRVLIKLKSYLSQSPTADINSAAKELGIHPYVAKKTNPLLRRFGIEYLKKIYKKVLELDAGLKSGMIEPRLGIELLVGQI
jgi:DNA polymerase-3 subunit delta